MNDQLSFSLGAIYTSSTVTNIPGRWTTSGQANRLNYSELDLIAGVSFDAGFAKFGLIYTYYNFFDTFSGSIASGQDAGSFGNDADRDSKVKSAQDLGFTVSKSFGPVNTTVGYWYDFKIGGHYLEASADCPVELTSWLSVVPSVSTGYGSDYYSYASIQRGTASGFTTVRPAISFPVKVTDSAVFTPYAAMNFSQDARYNVQTASNVVEGRNDFYFGGKMSVSF